MAPNTHEAIIYEKFFELTSRAHSDRVPKGNFVYSTVTKILPRQSSRGEFYNSGKSHDGICRVKKIKVDFGMTGIIHWEGM